MKPSRFIEVMEELRHKAELGPRLELYEVFRTLGHEGHAVLLVFLCLPYLQPIPIPGLSTPFGLLVAVVAYLYYRGRPAFLPERFHHLTLSSNLVLKVVEVSEKIWAYCHRRIYERWEIFFTQPFFRLLSLAIVASNGVLLALPLPIPFSNTVPTIAILLNSLGQMERDGLFVLLSYLWSFLSFGFFIALSLGTVWGIHKI